MAESTILQADHDEIARPQRQGWLRRLLAWVDRKFFLYNVTTGLYMLDWWERYLFSILNILAAWQNLARRGRSKAYQPMKSYGGCSLIASVPGG